MKVIREYYSQADMPEMFLNSKIAMFEKHLDIAKEFEAWIKTGEYKIDGVSEQGYTAKDLSEISPFLDGEGAFSLLIQLRENPNKALKKIKNKDSFYTIK